MIHHEVQKESFVIAVLANWGGGGSPTVSSAQISLNRTDMSYQCHHWIEGWSEKNNKISVDAIHSVLKAFWEPAPAPVCVFCGVSYLSQIAWLSFLSFLWYILIRRRQMWTPLSFSVCLKVKIHTMFESQIWRYLRINREFPLSLCRSEAVLVFFLVFILVYVGVTGCVVVVFVLDDLSDRHARRQMVMSRTRHNVMLLFLLSLTSYSVTFGPAVTVET